jgi:hypothetical protein
MNLACCILYTIMPQLVEISFCSSFRSSTAGSLTMISATTCTSGTYCGALLSLLRFSTRRFDYDGLLYIRVSAQSR